MTSGGPGGSGHWWSPAPAPAVTRPISARRAYGEALGVYLAFFGASIVVAAGTLGGLHITNPEGWWVTGSDGLDEIAQAALALTVVILLAGRRGRGRTDIGLVAARAKGGPGLKQSVRMAAWATLALVIGSIVTSALATGSFPFGHRDAANTILELFAAVNAGIVEETVVLAFLVTTLEQAGRGRAEIALVALVCRAAYHIYYGPGALGILVWAAVFLWLFWRFRSIVPMVIVHVCWDSLVFLGEVARGFSAVLVLAILILSITAFVLWLVDRSEQRARRRPGWASAWVGPTAWGPPAGGTAGVAGLPPAGPGPTPPRPTGTGARSGDGSPSLPEPGARPSPPPRRPRPPTSPAAGSAPRSGDHGDWGPPVAR